MHFAWLDGVIAAAGEFVHINYDDDFIAPTFVEKCMGLMGPDVAFCLSCAEVRDDTTQKTMAYLFGSLGPTGVYPVRRFMSHVINGLVSPGATVLRRKDIIDHLLVGRVPFTSFEYRGVGPDWLMTAMTTLEYRTFGYVDEPLAVFSAHDGSITVDASKDPARAQDFARAYREARLYYVITRMVKAFRLDVLARVWLFTLTVVAKIRNVRDRRYHTTRRWISYE